MENMNQNQDFKPNSDNLVNSFEESSPSRTRRSATSRTAFSRVSEDRHSVSFGDSQFNLPKSVVEKLKAEGKVVGFVVYSSMNEEQRDNYLRAQDRGWDPLCANEYPELTRRYNLAPFSSRESDEFVKRGGQITMIRSKEQDDAERKYYDSEVDRTNKMLREYSFSGGEIKPYIDQRKPGLR